MKKQIFIKGEPTTYYITKDGNLYNEKTNRWYKGSISGGYLKYDLRWEDKKYTLTAHRLVAEYFIPNANNLPIVNHKDGNKLNNNADNLEWVTTQQNNIHAYENNLKSKTNGMDQRTKIEDSIIIENEQWKQYKNTTYMISDHGRLKNIKTGNLLKGKITSKGYIEWCLSFQGKKHSYLAHRLVYETFFGEIKEGYVINHIDGNKSNNNIKNLESVTHSENIKHSYYQLSHKNLKRVGKFNLEGELIKIYPSCAAAARDTENAYSNLISNVCNGKAKVHCGYKWKYLEE